MANSNIFVQTIPNVFSEDECRRIIGLGLSQPLKPGYSPGMTINPEKRSSMIRFIYVDDATHWLFNRLWKIVNASPHGEDISTLNFIQFTEYKQEYGGLFRIHRDTEHFYHATDTRSLKRKITLVTQLSDPATYEGGDLVIYAKKGEKIVAPDERGCGIMFHSNMRHEVKRVTLGTRYSLVAWFEGSK